MPSETPPSEGHEQLDQLPDRIGPYEILDLLGEGGMGVVYRAQQKHPVRRRVAIKVIKPGMDTKQVVARFESERQALAVMDHPGIATVYDGGVTEAGRPYFAMELVKGVPITEYADTHRLTTAERIQLIIDACSAVQHAHQKGVIHRDIKPSNILVTLQDGRPITKIIDFGIAKAIGPGSLTARTMVTQLGQMIGTPRYMSPEQAEMTGLDVDTRTDVYSLGMILYELLVGDLPLHVDAAAEGVRPFVVRHRDAPRPSVRFSSLPDSWNTVARLRQSDPNTLRRELKGDLDWIVMRAIDPDRTRRYETANGLAVDLQRFLDHVPVSARPPSARYRLGKFVRRNRLVVGMGGALAALTLVFAVAMGLQANRVALERDRTALEAQTAQRISAFLVELFAVSDPSEARGRTITALEILERGAARIEEELSDEPAVQSRLLQTMGTVYMRLGLYDRAEELIQQGLQASRRGGAAADTAVATSLRQLAWLYRSQRRADDALPLARQAVEILQESVGVEDPRYASALQVLGMVERDLDDFEAARATLGRSLEIRRRVLAPGHEDIGWNLYHIGWLTVLEGRYHEARQHYEEAIRILEATLPADDPQLGWPYNDMAIVLRELGEYEESRQMHERVLAVRERTQGPDHPDVAATLGGLANTLWASGDSEDALEYLRRALAIQEKSFGPDHARVGQTLNNMGLNYQRLGRYVEAKDAYEAALRIEEADPSTAGGGVPNSLANLGYLYRYLGHLDAARPLLERALTLGENALGHDHIQLTGALVNLGFLENDMRRYAEAVAYFERAYAIVESTFGSEHPRIVDAARYLGSALGRSGDLEKAAEILEHARAVAESHPGNLSTASVVTLGLDLGAVRRALGNEAAGDSLLRQATDLTREASGEDSAEYAHVETQVWAIRGDLDRALEWFDRAAARGYRDPWLLRDPFLDLLHGHPRYEAVAAEIREAVRLDAG
jgi:non-specific serine/threonine protein kinase/serine/threonine-protein kinase